MGKLRQESKNYQSGWPDLNRRPLVPQIWPVPSLLNVTVRFSGFHESLSVCEGQRKATFMKLRGEFGGEDARLYKVNWAARKTTVQEVIATIKAPTRSLCFFL